PRSQLYQGLALPNKAIIPASPCKVGLRQILCNIVYFYFAKNTQSTFRAYISKKPEFQRYFDSGKQRKAVNEVIRFETPPAEQA
ncbi:hypothetical protein M3576_18700, partial [Weizmannia ginsengihumi]|nr:hypothetical protein [Heyndrickxia ginsengihumi]